MRRNLKFHFWLDLKRAIFFNFFSQIPKLLKNYNFTSQITKHEKDSPRSQHFFHIDNFSKLFSLGVSEFCHQINFDGNELFPRPDTLCYTVELAHCNVPYFYIYHFLPPPARSCALCSSGPCPSGRKLQALQCIAESHTFWEVGRKIPFYL